MTMLGGRTSMHVVLLLWTLFSSFCCLEGFLTSSLPVISQRHPVQHFGRMSRTSASIMCRLQGSTALSGCGGECDLPWEKKEDKAAQGGRRAFMEKGLMFLSSVGGLVLPVGAEEGPPPEVTSRRRRGSAPFGFEEVQERLVASFVKQDPGGFLFDETVFKTNIDFPEWMEGKWLVRSTLDEISYPLGKKYLYSPSDQCKSRKVWSPMGPCFLPNEKEGAGKEYFFKTKFLNELKGVHRDHRFNIEELYYAYDIPYELRGVTYDRSKKVLMAQLRPKDAVGPEDDATMSIRKIRGFGTPRCDMCSTFVCWDLLEASLKMSTGATDTRRFEIITSYHITDSPNKDPLQRGDPEEGEFGDTIEALQRVVLYLGPQDERYEEVKGYGVAHIDSKLVLRRILLDEENDSTTGK